MYCVVAVRECRSSTLKVSYCMLHWNIVVSATPTCLIAEDVKVRSIDATATLTREAVQPPIIVFRLPTI